MLSIIGLFISLIPVIVIEKTNKNMLCISLTQIGMYLIMLN